MWNKVDLYIKKHKLLNFNDLYIVALSGGADSVALLLLLKEAGYQVHAAHCNFHLRGDESDRDEAFCLEFCKSNDIELHRAHFDTYEYAEAHKVSIEMAARKLRYRWFAQLAGDLGAAGVCVAHHRDDSVETVLLNLVRGTGFRGLTGIRPCSELKIGQGDRHRELSVRLLRPLLCVSRGEIEGFLSQRGQKCVVDSSNLKADVQRNKIRLQVLPLLRELNPSVSDNIQRMTENVTEAQKVLETILGKYRNCKELSVSELTDFGSSEYIIFEWLKNYGFNGSQVSKIMEADTGSIFSSTMGYDVLVDRGRLMIEPSLKPLEVIRLPEEGTYVLSEHNNKEEERIEKTSVKVCKCAPYVSKDACMATLDARKICFPLIVRRVEEGDWFIPYGMQGRKLLSDFMTDRKMTVFEKRRQLVVIDAQGIIVWVVGLRIDQRAAVTEATQEVVEISFTSVSSCQRENHNCE